MNLLKKNLFIFLSFLWFSICSQDSYYRSIGAGTTFSKLSEQDEIGKLLNMGYRIRSTPKERLKLIDEAYQLTKLKQDSTLLPYIFFHYAQTYSFLSDNKNELKYLDKIIEIVEWRDFNYLLSRVNSYKAGTHQINGNYDKAIKLQISIIKNTDFPHLKALANSNIASMYITKNKYKIAKPHIDAVFEYYKNNTEEGLNHKNLAFEYQFLSFYTKNVKEKIELVSKGIQLTKKRSILNQVAAYGFRADLYLSLKKNNLAISDYQSALKLAKENQIIYLIPDIYHSLASLFLKQNNSKKALIQLDSANKYIKEPGLKLKKENAALRYKAFAKLNDSKNAFFYAKEYIKYQDSILNKGTDSLYIAYGKKYQTDKKIKENEILTKDNLIKDLEVKKQTTNRNYLIGLSLMGLIVLFSVYYRYRAKKKTAAILTSQNTIINNQKVALEKSNANKQRLFGIIAHDLVNPFNAILGYTQLLEEDYDSFNDKERKNFITTINKYANSNFKLTRTLLDWAKIQQDQLVVNKAILNCKDVVNEAIQPYQVLADKKNIHINTHISDTIFVEADKNMMQTVIGNLFVNAIKFTPQNGEIKFQLHKNNDGTIKIEIEDNGIGMSQEQLNNMFDITKVNTRQGTNNEKGNGLGLILCKELMELQKGTLQMFSQLNKGSRAVVTI